MKSCRPSPVEAPYSRPSVASTAPVRPSSPAGSPSEPSEQGSRPPRCRSARQIRPCTSWRPLSAHHGEPLHLDHPSSALRDVIDGWFYILDHDAKDGAAQSAGSGGTLDLLHRRLSDVSKDAPAFAAVLRQYRLAQTAGDSAEADGLLAWLGGQPHVAASVKRAAGVRGDLDHFGALGFLQGLLTVLRDFGLRGPCRRPR